MNVYFGFINGLKLGKHHLYSNFANSLSGRLPNNQMKSFLKKLVNGCLSPFNLKMVRARNNNFSGISLFDDLTQIFNKDSPVCLDVGANKGQTIESLLKVFSKPMIHAFEPSAKTFQILQSKKFCDQVFLHNYALGKVRQKREFYNYENSCLSSFLPLDSNEENRYRSVAIDNKEIVEVDTVDRFLQQFNFNEIDLLKIDTQGFDLDVLLGAKDALQNRAIRTVLVELNFVRKYIGQGRPEDIIHLLKENNMLIVDYYEKIRRRQNRTIAWCTALFERC